MRDANNTVSIVVFLTEFSVYLWKCFKLSPSFRNLKKSSMWLLIYFILFLLIMFLQNELVNFMNLFLFSLSFLFCLKYSNGHVNALFSFSILKLDLVRINGCIWYFLSLFHSFHNYSTLYRLIFYHYDVINDVFSFVLVFLGIFYYHGEILGVL